ncbi:MAG TPA: hypothetical protein VEW48_27265 [Thermoanaerobaculia bacterium]|nr:hypothetical protein [Thermoanaerobaculia bacterium]
MASEIMGRSGWRRLGLILGIVVLGLGACWVLLPLVIVWAYFLASPFVDFTFTDLPDFVFAGLIVFTLAALLVRHRTTPYPADWITAASIAALVLALVSPFVPMAALHLLSRRGQELLGHWPRPMRDDPKYIGLDDPTYQRLSIVVIYAFCFTGWCLYTWGGLMLHLRKSLTTRKVLWLVALFVLTWLVFSYDPGKRFEWWLD